MHLICIQYFDIERSSVLDYDHIYNLREDPHVLIPDFAGPLQKFFESKPELDGGWHFGIEYDLGHGGDPIISRIALYIYLDTDRNSEPFISALGQFMQMKRIDRRLALLRLIESDPKI